MYKRQLLKPSVHVGKSSKSYILYFLLFVSLPFTLHSGGVKETILVSSDMIIESFLFHFVWIIIPWLIITLLSRMFYNKAN